ncbi:TlpA family protein disulfide reductase [Brumimicrobium aurantiacum]|uniref:TlpA family protein disulfide reductase n=1 Tax=Brumimicrobium aurantiacum TaxID=1737063 RepID=A0A3E1EWF5_9FLAO|nr:TlpA disulfide reductase family protein [Brumimicrobium aurantiacum]RFC53891.1 TlpA family protein disulfide reductase [Brumimicrobium aurantiacum]
MIRTFTLLVFTLLTTLGFTQEKETLLLKGQIFNTESDTLKLVQNDGKQNTVVEHISLDEKGFFEKSVELPSHDFYVLSLEDNQGVNFIYQGEDTLKIYGDGSNLLQHTNIIGSPSSTALLDFVRINTAYKAKLDSANKYLQANKSQQKQIQQDFQPVYQAFMGQRELFIRQNGDSPALIGVIPSVNTDQEFELYESIVKQLGNSFGESPTIKRIQAEFEVNKQKRIKNMPIAPGDQAKEIALPNPEGDTLRLSDYKGKVVLLDFWAAWCGPCRRENPNVVKLYKQYNEQGFEVFSVSLDKDIDKWEAAIAQDNLIWDGHVSDLQGWRSSAGKDYKVSSIPFTVLIDREGKVIGTNFRGEALGEKLKEIFEN